MQCPEPVGEPKWRGIVTAGDILYIPRGWWYLDDASGDAALYLVVSFINPLGADIVLRMAETLKSKEVIRMDIPRFRTPDHQSRYITNLQQEIIKAITQPSIFRSVLDTIREGAESLVEFNLPWSVRAEPSALSLDCRLVLLARFSLHDSLTRHRGLGWVDIPHNGRLIRFDDRIVAVIERLCRPATTTVRDLLQDCMPLLSETVILEYVVDLMRKGLLLVRRSGEDLDPINQVLPRPGKQEHLLC
jgi:hypothetical protein